MTRATLFLTVYLLTTGLSEITVQAQQPHIQLEPFDYLGLYEGSTAVFNCTTYRYDHLLWELNENPPFQFNPSVQEDPTDHRLLHSSFAIPGNIQYNNSRILCIGFSHRGNNLYKESILFLQGLPGKVENFIGTNTSSASIQFTWSPPYHVPGTECCIAYSVKITNIQTGEQIYAGNTTDPSYSFTVFLDQLCHQYSVRISAYNQLGEGELLETVWSLGGFFEANSADLSLSYVQEQNIRLGVNATIDGYCLNDLDNVTVSVQCKSSNETLSQTDNISAGHSVTQLHHYTHLLLPLSHHDSTCTSNVALENNVNLKGIQFDTFDVQDVDYILSPGKVCVSCSYLSLSPARGCVLVISELGVNSDIELYTNISIDVIEGCVFVTRGGRYRLRVFDWEFDDRRGVKPIINVIVSIEDPLPVVEPSISLPIVVRDSSESILGVEGIVTISVFSVVIGVMIVAICIAIVFLIRKRNRPHSLTSQTSQTIKIQGVDEHDGPMSKGYPWEEVTSYEQLNQKINEKLTKWFGNDPCIMFREETEFKYILLKKK